MRDGTYIRREQAVESLRADLAAEHRCGAAAGLRAAEDICTWMQDAGPSDADGNPVDPAILLEDLRRAARGRIDRARRELGVQYEPAPPAPDPDAVICPGCCERYSVERAAADPSCPHCGWTHDAAEGERLPTAREVAGGANLGPCSDVDPAEYARAVMAALGRL